MNKTLIVAAMAAWAAATAANASTVFTSTWDDTGIADNTLGVRFLTSGGQSWIAETNNVDVIGATNSLGLTSDNGTTFLDMAGTNGPDGQTILFTDFASTAGKIYKVTVRFAGNQLGLAPGGSFSVGFNDFFPNGAISISSFYAGDVPSGQPWGTASAMARATGSLSTVIITATKSADGNSGPLIDTVTVSVIPEPATWMMMILGFGLIAAQLRRRHQVALAA